MSRSIRIVFVAGVVNVARRAAVVISKRATGVVWFFKAATGDGVSVLVRDPTARRFVVPVRIEVGGQVRSYPYANGLVIKVGRLAYAAYRRNFVMRLRVARAVGGLQHFNVNKVHIFWAGVGSDFIAFASQFNFSGRRAIYAA